MQFASHPHDTSNGISMVITEHDGQSLIWDVKPYNRSRYCKREELWVEVNQYLETLAPEVHERIFKIYQQVYVILEDEVDIDEINENLCNLVGELYGLVNLGQLEHWVRMISSIQYPTNLQETIDTTDQNTIDRTYLLEDYRGLIVLTVAVKFMLPIWGAYMSRTGASSENAFKEYNALALLYVSELINQPYVRRLTKLIEALLSGYSIPLAATIGGLGSDDIGNWLLGLTLVRRLTLSPANRQEDTGHLISQIYRDILKNISGSLDKTFNGRIKPKHVTNEDGEEERISRAESYKEKQPISDGVKQLLNVFVEDRAALLSKVLPTGYDFQVWQAIVHEVENIGVYNPTDAQLNIMRWTLSKLQPDGTAAVPPSTIEFLNQKALCHSALAVTKMALWEWGIPDLAVVMTATPEPFEDGFIPAGNPVKLNKNTLLELIETYPHYITDATRKSLATEKDHLTAAKKNNPARLGIDQITETLFDCRWIVNKSDPLAEGLPTVHGREIHLPKDIRTQLLSLLNNVNQ